MKKYEGIELIRQLSEAFGPSGCEDGVRALIKEQIGHDCHEMAEDKAGNLHVRIKGRGMDYDVASPARLMICAHMDEVGLMVREITEEGYAKFSAIGQIDPRVLCGRHVLLGDETHTVKGVIASKAIHMQTPEERKRATPISKMYIDVGARDAEEGAGLTQIGDFGTFDSEFVTFGKDKRFMKGKALDDRLGCAAMIETARWLFRGEFDLPCDVYFSFTCNQEVGISGASAAAFAVDPTIALILEAVAVNDLPDAAPASRVAEVGGGCVLALADRNALYDAGLTRFAMTAADENSIKYQIKQGAADTTDGGAVQRSMAGVKCASLSVPVRYAHSASNVALYDDYQALCDLLQAMLKDWRL